MKETRKEKAVRLFKEGFNCSQAVFCAFCDEYNIDMETGLKLSASFGGGMGRMREVCGAVSGMFMVAGLETGSVNVKDNDAKQYNYEIVQKLADEYKKQNGSIICRELLGLTVSSTDVKPEERTETYYKKRPCVKLVEMAVEILEHEFYNDNYAEASDGENE